MAPASTGIQIFLGANFSKFFFFEPIFVWDPKGFDELEFDTGDQVLSVKARCGLCLVTEYILTFHLVNYFYKPEL